MTTDAGKESGEVDPYRFGCSQCGAKPRQECIGPGEGAHFVRWERASERLS